MRTSTPHAAKEAGNVIALAGAIVGTIGGLGDIAASSKPELANTVIFTTSCPFLGGSSFSWPPWSWIGSLGETYGPAAGAPSLAVTAT
jgi:hypothetical protein